MRADAEKCVARFINLFCWSESGSPDGLGSDELAGARADAECERRV